MESSRSVANARALAGPPAAVPPGGREAGGVRGGAAGDGDGGDGAVPRRGAAEGPRAGAAGLRRHARRRRRRLHPAFRRRRHEVLGLALAAPAGPVRGLSPSRLPSTH